MTIFPSPQVGQFTSVGVWSNFGEWVDAPHNPKGDARIRSIVNSESLQPKVRYTADGHYEMQMPGEAFERLVHHRNVGAPSSDNTLFELANSWGRTIRVSGSRAKGYRYSEMMTWWRPDLDFAFTADGGATAFGTITPTGSVPVTGTGTYLGTVLGITDANMGAEGDVRLAFDFGGGTLSGEMQLRLNEGMGWRDLGTYAFAQTNFARGSTQYSGSFATNLSGFNFFNGRFTGPGAEETIGSWAVPFSYDGNTHQAIGAWIAKRGN